MFFLTIYELCYWPKIAVIFSFKLLIINSSLNRGLKRRACVELFNMGDAHAQRHVRLKGALVRNNTYPRKFQLTLMHMSDILRPRTLLNLPPRDLLKPITELSRRLTLHLFYRCRCILYPKML